MTTTLIISLLVIIVMLLAIVVILKKKNSDLNVRITNSSREIESLNSITAELQPNLQKAIDTLLKSEESNQNLKNTIMILQFRNTKLKLENDKLKTKGTDETTH